MIAIKKLTEEDEQAFLEFLKTERRALPKLHIAPLPFPHETLAVFHKLRADNLTELAQSCGMTLTEVDAETTVLTCRPISKNSSETYAFSGYVLKDSKLTFGAEELASSDLNLKEIGGGYGEFNLLRISNDRIELTADFFGMSPWYYYSDGKTFAASNHYHLLLEALRLCGVQLTMNIRRSRVNIVTSGFTYGSNFTADMDVNNCYLSLPYEKIIYEAGRLTKENTELFQILTEAEPWDEDKYEDYLRKAKEEIYNNTLAYFSSDRFKQIVIDVSGGFDSRIVFATANNLPCRLRKKIATHTRRSGTRDDVEKAAGVTNLYDYKKVSYSDTDDSDVLYENEVNLAQISRSLGSYSANFTMYKNCYKDMDRLQLTGYLGEVVFGYKRVRGELDYSLGDKKLLSWLGGCYLWNSVEQLKGVFSDQEDIILASLNGYNCDDLLKKFHVLYTNYRNRFICSSVRNMEYNNLRVSPLHSKYALKAKWMYFRRFDNNKIPDEKISVDLLTMINPLMATVPFASNNDDVIPPKENLLWNINADIKPDFGNKPSERLGERVASEKLYKNKVITYMSDLSVAEQMLLQIYDYSPEYKPVCLGLYRVLREFRDSPEDLKSGHGMEQIRKIYDVYYQMSLCKPDKSGGGGIEDEVKKNIKPFVTIFERQDNKIIIESVYVDGQKLKADIIDNGQRKCLWFHYSDNYKPEALNADAFLIYLVRYAMIFNRDIVSKVPVHYELLNSINRLLIPAMKLAHVDNAKMKVSAPILATEDCRQAPGVATGLSCGVDSFYALLNHYQTGDKNLDVTHLFFFDMFHTDINYEWETFNYCQKVASELGFSIIRICTNVLKVLEMNWFPMHLYSLFAGVNSMQNIIGKYYLASGLLVTDVNMNNALWTDPAHYELLLVKAFHHKDMEIYIEGPVTRIDKTDFIADFPIAQNRLSVCWPRPYNSCGICPKCVRTLVDLDALGKLDKFGAVFDLAHYKANRDWYLSFARTESDYGNILYFESVRRLKARGEEITETFEDKMAEIVSPQSEKILSYFEQNKLKSVLFFGRRYEKFVDEIADILSRQDIKVYCYVKDKNQDLPAVARDRVEFVSLEQLSSSYVIDAMILISLTLNLKCYSGLFNKMERSLKSSVHLSEIIDIPFFKGKEIEVELNKTI